MFLEEEEEAEREGVGGEKGEDASGEGVARLPPAAKYPVVMERDRITGRLPPTADPQLRPCLCLGK